MTNPQEPVEPKWNAADPYGSFHRYADYLHQRARLVFLKDKTHVELMFIFRTKGAIALLQVPSDRRDEFMSDLRK
jgi:hypothetical protein